MTLRHTLGASGERTSVTELDRTVEYTYDSLYRLTAEKITVGKKVTEYTYSYDNVSNRTLKTENGKETQYVYNALNQIISDDDTSYEYDLNGNLVRVIGTGNTALYEYNAENKLIKATVQQGNNVVVETYTYDYAGKRTSKTTRTSNGNVEFVKYLNDNSSLTNVLVEINSDDTEKCFYTIGADLISQETDGEISYYLYDGHGTVRALADIDGSITDTYSYDAFGNLLHSTGETANNYRYCGEQFDSTTGLYYLRARYMDTSTGRFISQDSYAGSTADPISLHKYLYANSNPVMYCDPSGYMTLGDTMTSCAMIGALSGGMINAGMNVLRFLIGDPNMTSKYDSPLAAFFDGFIDGIIWGAMFGISIATFMTLGIFVALNAAFCFGFSYYFYTLSKTAAAENDWSSAILYLLLSFSSMLNGFATISMAIESQQVVEEMARNNKNSSTSNAENNSSAGLIGKDYEDYLNKEIGGSGSFKVDGREFDGAIGNRWWEAKSGNYWNNITSTPSGFSKFCSDMGHRLAIAKSNGATYELFSNTPIPDYVKEWLIKKGIEFTETL